MLDAIHQRNVIELVIHGGCSGADELAGEWAKANMVPEATYPVLPEEWKAFGRSAGPMRNTRMLRDAKPDGVVAFPGGRGTADMVRQAEAAGVKVMKVDWS